MAKKRTKAYPQEIYRKIEEFRLFDDTFMSKVFDGQKEETALLLQIILGDPGIKVISVHAQVEVKNLQGRSVRLDIRARDSKGVIFAVEIQRDDAGASPKRSREISSLLDANALRAGQDFDRLPETYVIFITEHDVLKKGRPIYHIDRTVEETGELFGDMAHIIYVNGENDDDTDLGRLMHDFHCTQAEEMLYPLLAKRVKYFKETQKGQETMCAAVEEYANEVATEREQMTIRQSLLKGFRGGLTKEMAKTMFPKMKMKDLELIYQEAKKPVRGRRPAVR